MFISNINIFLTILLTLTAVIGDYLVYHSNLHLFRAIFDNATHAVIGGISWLTVCFNVKRVATSSQTLFEIAVCTIIASAIDLDHFIAAKSFHLKDATNLKSRPPLHCSTIPIFLGLALLGFSYIYQVNFIKKCALMLLTAFLSHHTRDATRRGYWLYPLGDTPPLPYACYVILTCCIPRVIAHLDHLIKINDVGDKFSINVI